MAVQMIGAPSHGWKKGLSAKSDLINRIIVMYVYKKGVPERDWIEVSPENWIEFDSRILQKN
jgi:hypothetical protein